MKSKIIFKEFDDYLLIKYVDYNAVDEFLASLDRAVEICKTKNYSYVMLDIYDFNHSKVTNMDRLFAGNKIAECSKRISNSIKFAIVGNEERYNKFMNILAINKGIIFKVFNNKDDAINWIKNK